MIPTKEQAHAYVAIVKAIADAIKELGEVPSGHLYAGVSSRLELGYYQQIIELLKNAGLVEETPNHLLRWVAKS